MEYSYLEILSGIFLIIFVVASIFIGIKISLKYRTAKKKELITIGLTWILLITPNLMNLLNFLANSYVSTGSLTLIDRFITPYTIPIATICWIYSFNNLVYLGKKKKVMLFYFVLSIIYMVYNTVFLIIEFSLSLDLKDIYDMIEVIYLIFCVLSFLATGIIFCRKSLESEDLKIKTKGVLLLTAFSLFITGTLLILIGRPINLYENIEYYLFIRIFLLIPSAIFYYLGFFLPVRIENWIKRKQEKT